MLEIKDLSKKYSSVMALNGLSLLIDSGEIIGIFGENGAGKTTLMKSIFGFIPCQGEILLDGEKITRKNIGRLAFATCEHSFFPSLTANDHEAFYREQFKTFRPKRFETLMNFFDLSFNRSIRSFSTGQQNQFEVIMALSQGADYIFMDEPFAGNDIFNREDFYKVILGILEPNETIILSTHLIEEVENFIDRAVLIHQGKKIGDAKVEQLQEERKTVTGFVKESFNYRAERVMDALNNISEA